MKLLCVLAGLCLVAHAAHMNTQTADKTFLTKQKNIYELFWHIDQPTVYHPELYQIARTFNLQENVDNFADQKAVQTFLALLKKGMIPRGQVFSVMNPQMQKQAATLFHLLHSAKTFEVFYNTAVWARFHVNEQMYIYALATAVIQRPDTTYIKLPPLYEVLPQLFFNDDVMHKAYNIAMGDMGMKKTVSGVDYYIVPANYSSWYFTTPDMEHQKLSYFTEDIGLNMFYFMANHNYPTFMNTTIHKLPKGNRGEYYFFLHKQLLARYYLERLCNGLGEIENISVDKPIVTGYQPNMHHRNGLRMPQRHSDAMIPLSMHKQVQTLKDLHTRISWSIDFGATVDAKGNPVNLYTENGLNTLGNMVQGNADSINQRLYGSLDLLARKLFGFGLESNVKYQVVPSALEIFSTSMRDPAFYSIYKNILSYYFRYKENLPAYTTEDLQFTGVKIESMDVDKLVTYFDYFEAMLSNGVSIRSHKEAQNMLIKARQYRLNHKPFTYNLIINSDKDAQAILRIFMGPKFDVNGHEIDLENNWMNFVQLDEWIVNLKSGQNEIQRGSHDSTFVVPDEIPSDLLYKKMTAGLEGSESYVYSTQPYGFPDRLILPKGRKDGMPVKLFVMVSPYDVSKHEKIDDPIWGTLVSDLRSMGFPLDRPIDPLHFHTPNMYTKDVMIYHKEMEEVNVTA